MSFIKTNKFYASEDSGVGTIRSYEPSSFIFGKTLYSGTISSGFSGDKRGSFAGGIVSGTGTINAEGAGSFAVGTVDSGIISAGKASFAQGYVTSGKIYTHLVDSIGSFAQGYTGSYGFIYTKNKATFAQGFAGLNRKIKAVGRGSFAQGYAKSGDIVSSGTGSFAQGYITGTIGKTIEASGNGSFAQGYINNGDIKALANGSFAQGYATDGDIINNIYANGSFAQGCVKTGKIYNNCAGSFAQGYTSGAGSLIGNSFVGYGGCFAQGCVLLGGKIFNSGKGSFAQGYVSGSTSSIYTENTGNFAQGYVKNGKIAIKGYGSFVQGLFINSSVEILNSHGNFVQKSCTTGVTQVSGNGNFNQGRSVSSASNTIISGSGCFVQILNGRNLYCTGKGSFIQGYSYRPMTVSGNGCFFQGRFTTDSDTFEITSDGGFFHGVSSSTSGPISISGIGAAAFCAFGTVNNNVNNSLQIGSDTNQIRIIGNGSAPYPSIRNGDIWISNGNVYIRTNGISRNLTTI